MTARSTKPAKKKPLAKAATPAALPLLADLRRMILQTRESVARTVDTGLTALCWHIGRRMLQDVLKHKRADYGERIVSATGRQLEREFGRGYSEKSLRHMIRFAEAFPDERIVSALRRQLTWTHFKSLVYIEDPLKRDFYAEMCRLEGWNTRTLEKKIGGMLFERTALSKKPDLLIRQELDALRAEDRLTPDLIFRDPYFLDFLGLKDSYAEKDLETALLREIESFLLELGTGFAFVARQKRFTLDGVDYHMDLLFYHRRLKRLVVVELKLDDFQPADFGQIELYLRWLDRNERQAGEERPMGLILCAGKKAETVEYLDLDRSGVHVAEYLTELPPRKVLQRKLHDAVRLARARLGAGKD